MKIVAGILPRSPLGRVIGAITETADIISAIYGAIPSKYRRKGVTIQGKADAIWKHFDEIDWWKAFQNLTENQIEDFVFGRIGRIGKRASRKLGEWSGKGHGIGTGPLH